MKNLQLKNQLLTVSIQALGAELQSIQSIDQTEYLWQGDPEYWGKKAPILFPIVGKLNQDRFSYKQTNYPMTQHGFARDRLFSIVKQSQTSATFSLESDEQSLNIFPFQFALTITYTLENNQLTVDYTVKNTDTKTIFFSIGAHPGFSVPLVQGEKKEDYFLTFEPAKERKYIPVTDQVLLDANQVVYQQIEKIPLTNDLFAKGVLIYETPGENTIVLASKHQTKKISLSYNKMNYLGLWSPYPKDAPFICIEPWAGVADVSDFSDDFSNKLGIQSLAIDDTFHCSYSMTFE